MDQHLGANERGDRAVDVVEDQLDTLAVSGYPGVRGEASQAWDEHVPIVLRREPELYAVARHTRDLVGLTIIVPN